MGAPAKFTTVYGITGKLEGSYNAGGSLSISTDGILLDENPKMPPFGYANDGSRPPAPGALDSQRRVAPSGRILTGFPIKPRPQGPNSAYSASVIPNVHIPMRFGGFDATLTTTGGLEKYVYFPSLVPPTNYASGVLGCYLRGELAPLQGVLADLTYSFNAGEVPVYEFSLSGLAGAVTDVALPALAYPNLDLSKDPAKAINVTLVLGNFTSGAIRKLTLKMSRQISPRLDANVGGHAGYAPGRRTPTIEVTYEAPALVGAPFTGASTVDPYQLYDSANVVACSWAVGSTQYNRHKWSAPTVQVMSAPKPDEDANGVALTTLSLQVNPSSVIQQDSLTNTWD